MRKLIPLTIMIVIMALSSIVIVNKSDKAEVTKTLKPRSEGMKSTHGAHDEFAELQVDFNTGREVTAACLRCHESRAEEVMYTTHWTWMREEEIPQKGVVPFGKRNALSSFCLGIQGSEQNCTQCHIGYGFSNTDFDFEDKLNVDCLICHDNTGTYKKAKDKAGCPDESVDLGYVARNVGYPTKSNCGSCHFDGGVGNNGRHGDLDKAMTDCLKEIDVHMGSDGRDMSCVDCHTTEDHWIMGKLYTVSSENVDRVSCEQCHSSRPHEKELLNEHFLRIACQTCHIPYYAKLNNTNTWLDWSDAGKLDQNGMPLTWFDELGDPKYMSDKGTFVWNDQLEPQYTWFNGTASHYLLGEKIDTNQLPLKLNTLLGEYCIKDMDVEEKKCSKIIPVKIHRAKLPYDPVNQTMLQPKLFAESKGEGGYWQDYDWEEANLAGMEEAGLDYSGKYEFIETEMYLPINHQVTTSKNALSCVDCHVRSTSRIENLGDFYLPGRDRNLFLDRAGLIMILTSILGVIIHFILRIIYQKRCFLV
jgi:octaheme c-type cytochrome (tetrathionate reductase family)